MQLLIVVSLIQNSLANDSHLYTASLPLQLIKNSVAKFYLIFQFYYYQTTATFGVDKENTIGTIFLKRRTTFIMDQTSITQPAKELSLSSVNPQRCQLTY